jgi:hypothetical protein
MNKIIGKSNATLDMLSGKCKNLEELKLRLEGEKEIFKDQINGMR